MVESIETDYLVIGAGATAMAFVDELLTWNSHLRVTMVDRRPAPGGHWNDAYPFVTLHQPAIYYGVNSEQLGRGGGDLVSKSEILEYFAGVLRKHEGGGRLAYYPECEYQGARRFVSQDGVAHEVKVARRVVDTTYSDITVPSTSAPSYKVDASLTLVPINALVEHSGGWARYVVIGAGKTGIDAVLYLLATGVAAGEIAWVVPNDAWLYDRAHLMPERLADFIPTQLRYVAQCAGLEDLMLRMEAGGQLMRLDPDVWPTKFRCATVLASELVQLRKVQDVVRKGRVAQLTPEQMILTEGTHPLWPDTLFVDCTADGLKRRPPRPIFDGGLITLQPVTMCQPTHNAAMVAAIELRYNDDRVKNAMTVPVPHPNHPEDFLPAFLATIQNMDAWALPFTGWNLRSRLSAAAHMGAWDLCRFFARTLFWRGRGLAKLKALVSDQPDAPG